VFVPGKTYHASLLFEGMARSLHKSEQPERSFPWVGLGLTRKHSTRLERLAKEKDSNLLQRFINYGRKKFYNIGFRSVGRFFALLVNIRITL
jgi:hypothetical protein